MAVIVNGNMAVSASGRGGMMVRVDPATSDRIVSTTCATPMEMRGKAMAGWLRVAPEDIRTKRRLARWVTLGMSYTRSLPAKR